jgi:hypothetical protein
MYDQFCKKFHRFVSDGGSCELTRMIWTSSLNDRMFQSHPLCFAKRQRQEAKLKKHPDED